MLTLYELRVSSCSDDARYVFERTWWLEFYDWTLCVVPNVNTRRENWIINNGSRDVYVDYQVLRGFRFL